MFAGKHSEQSGALNEAAERAFAVMLELIEQGQAEGALETASPSASASSCSRRSRASPRSSRGGMVDAEQVDELVADAIAHFLRGSERAGTPA